MKTINLITLCLLFLLIGGVASYFIFKDKKPVKSESEYRENFRQDSLELLASFVEERKILSDSIFFLKEEKKILKIRRSKTKTDTVWVKSLIEDEKTDTACRRALISQMNHIEVLEVSIDNLEAINENQEKVIDLRQKEAAVYDSLLKVREGEIIYLSGKTKKLKRQRNIGVGAAALILIIKILK